MKDERLQFDIEMDKMVRLLREGGMVRYDDAERVFKRHFVAYALERHGGNATHTARELGVHRNTLGRYMAELHLAGSGKIGRPVLGD